MAVLQRAVASAATRSGGGIATSVAAMRASKLPHEAAQPSPATTPEGCAVLDAAAADKALNQAFNVPAHAAGSDLFLVALSPSLSRGLGLHLSGAPCYCYSGRREPLAPCYQGWRRSDAVVLDLRAGGAAASQRWAPVFDPPPLRRQKAIYDFDVDDEDDEGLAGGLGRGAAAAALTSAATELLAAQLGPPTHAHAALFLAPRVVVVFIGIDRDASTMAHYEALVDKLAELAPAGTAVTALSLSLEAAALPSTQALLRRAGRENTPSTAGASAGLSAEQLDLLAEGLLADHDALLRSAAAGLGAQTAFPLEASADNAARVRMVPVFVMGPKQSWGLCDGDAVHPLSATVDGPNGLSRTDAVLVLEGPGGKGMEVGGGRVLSRGEVLFRELHYTVFGVEVPLGMGASPTFADMPRDAKTYALAALDLRCLGLANRRVALEVNVQRIYASLAAYDKLYLRLLEVAGPRAASAVDLLGRGAPDTGAAPPHGLDTLRREAFEPSESLFVLRWLERILSDSAAAGRSVIGSWLSVAEDKVTGVVLALGQVGALGLREFETLAAELKGAGSGGGDGAALLRALEELGARTLRALQV
uniref:Uncharacterized protein n=2 Tax=Phaeomonas parva TaxID=124430 RepID=A0A7S1TWC5_9STRA